MKFFTSFLILLLSIQFAFSQKVEDKVYASVCSDNTSTRSIHESLSRGKMLLIVSNLTNCKECTGIANDVAAYTYSHKDVQVWGALNYLYKYANCVTVKDVVHRYSWDGMFVFIDSTDRWSNGTSTYFTLLNPKDNTIYWEGSSWETAQVKIEELRVRNTPIPEKIEALVEDVFPNPFGKQLRVKVLGNNNDEVVIRILDILGQEKAVYVRKLEGNRNELSLDVSDKNLETGVYMVRVSVGAITKTTRLIKN